jgi:hypothetical protein
MLEMTTAEDGDLLEIYVSGYFLGCVKKENISKEAQREIDNENEM